MNDITTKHLSEYKDFFTKAATQVRQARIRAAQSVSREAVTLYWWLGEHIAQHQSQHISIKRGIAMKQRIRWQFTDEQLTLIKKKHRKNRLYYALQLKFYETHLTFFNDVCELSSKVIYQVAKKIDGASKLSQISQETKVNCRKAIRAYFQSRMPSAQDESHIKDWLYHSVLSKELLTYNQSKEKAIG